MQDTVRLVGADPDSQYCLRACRCGAGGERVAYAQGLDGSWRALCMVCGAESGVSDTRHGAQMEWNFGGLEGSYETKQRANQHPG